MDQGFVVVDADLPIRQRDYDRLRRPHRLHCQGTHVGDPTGEVDAVLLLPWAGGEEKPCPTGGNAGEEQLAEETTVDDNESLLIPLHHLTTSLSRYSPPSIFFRNHLGAKREYDCNLVWDGSRCTHTHIYTNLVNIYTFDP